MKNMVDEQVEPAAINLVREETLEPPPPSGYATSHASTTPDVVNCSVSRDQVPDELQCRLAAAENRVSKALQQVMESIETRLLGALRQAAIDIIENLGKEAAACLVTSERKASVLEQQLNSTKQQALSMLMRLKHVSDAQMSDAERRILIERRRAQDAEAKLYSTQESNKRLKAELKRKVQLLEEFQRSIFPAETKQGLQLGFTEGSDSRKRGNKLKGLAGGKPFVQTSCTPCEPCTPATSPGLTTVDISLNGAVEVQSANITSRPPGHNLTYLNAYTSARIQMGMPALEVLPPKTCNLHVKDNLLLLTEDDHVTGEKPNGLHEEESPMRATAFVQGGETKSGAVHRASLSADCHSTFYHIECLPVPVEQAQIPSPGKANLELRSVKNSNEGKSCLILEALHCDDEVLPAQVHPTEDHQSHIDHAGIGLQTSDVVQPRDSHFSKANQEADISVDCTELVKISRKCAEQENFSMDCKEQLDDLLHPSGSPKMNEEKHLGVDSSFLLQSGAATKDIQGWGSVYWTGSLDSLKVHPECGEGGDSTETAATNAGADLVNALPVSPELVNPNSKASLVNSQALNPISNHSGSNLPTEDIHRPETQKESPGNPVVRRKRKVGVLVSKYDFSVKDRNSKELKEEGAVTEAFDHLLAAAGVDTHISSRDSRRLMQGARQLFSLAERKWR